MLLSRSFPIPLFPVLNVALQVPAPELCAVVGTPPSAFQRRAISAQDSPALFRLSASRHSAALSLSGNGSRPLSLLAFANSAACRAGGRARSDTALSRNALTVVPNHGSPPRVSRLSPEQVDSHSVTRLKPSSFRRSLQPRLPGRVRFVAFGLSGHCGGFLWYTLRLWPIFTTRTTSRASSIRQTIR